MQCTHMNVSSIYLLSPYCSSCGPRKSNDPEIDRYSRKDPSRSIRVSTTEENLLFSDQNYATLKQNFFLKSHFMPTWFYDIFSKNFRFLIKCFLMKPYVHKTLMRLHKRFYPNVNVLTSGSSSKCTHSGIWAKILCFT